MLRASAIAMATRGLALADRKCYRNKMGIRDAVLTRQGDALRAWRKNADISQGTAAERIGAKQGSWAAWELGRKAPDGYYAGKIEELTDGAVRAAGWAYPRIGTSGAREADAESGTDVTAPAPVSRSA